MLDVLIAGPEAGLPLVFHSGTPAGLVGLGPMAEAVSARGLRAVLYSRPGYGGSTPQPGRLVADAGADLAPVLGRRAARAFITAGWSAGGPPPLGPPAPPPPPAPA